MINKIYTIEQLKRKIEISDLAIWANDWIGELLKQYVYCELNMQIQIHAVDEYYFAKHILLVGHEMEMDKIAMASQICHLILLRLHQKKIVWEIKPKHYLLLKMDMCLLISLSINKIHQNSLLSINTEVVE